MDKFHPETTLHRNKNKAEWQSGVVIPDRTPVIERVRARVTLFGVSLSLSTAGQPIQARLPAAAGVEVFAFFLGHLPVHPLTADDFAHDMTTDRHLRINVDDLSGHASIAPLAFMTAS